MSKDIFQVLGLKGNPFSPATSTTGYFHTPATQRLLEEIHFGIVHRRGFILLIGEVGVGKTSLLLQLLERLHDETKEDLHTAWVFNTVLSRSEFLYALAEDFGLQPSSQASFSQLLTLIHDFFLRVSEQGGNCAIVVDEAHNLDDSTLESLRLLSNLESEERKLVQIVLAGQPELQSRLDQGRFRQLRSRIAISNVLPPLDKREIKRYVDFKLSSTNSQLALPRNGVQALWAATKGNIRLINLIMERALHAMYALGRSELSPRIIRMALSEVALFQKDVSNHISRRKKGLLLLVTAGCLVGVLTLMALGPFGPLGTGQFAVKGDGPSANSSGRVGKGVEQGTLVAGQKVQNTAVDARLTDFLAPFGQGELAPVLVDALRWQTPGLLQSRLPNGLELIGLSSLPEQDPGFKFSCFPWREYSGGPPDWLVLWRPPIKVPKFFPDYVGPEIKRLQTRLKALGHYELPADGYLGSRTWRAIAQFQKSYGLKRTGTPNPKTLFWLFAGSRPSNLLE